MSAPINPAPVSGPLSSDEAAPKLSTPQASSASLASPQSSRPVPMSKMALPFSHHRHSSLHSLVATTMALSSKAHYTTHHMSEHIQKHLQRVYDDIRGKEPVLTTPQLLDFLKNSQDIEAELTPEQDKKEWKFGEFLEVVEHVSGFNGVRTKIHHELDLKKPISNYFISSSHNTYLQGNQLSSKSSTEAYKVALRRGCRCIEIDVWNGEAKDSASTPKLANYVSTQGPTAISSKLREAKEKASYFAEKLGFGHHDDDEPHYHKKTGSSSHQKVPSINTHPDPDDLRDLESAIDSTVLFDTPLETHSSRSSRHNSHSSSKAADRFEPRVLHGWTLTPDVGFRDVCKAIKDTAFETSKLPIIVSLEVHADLEQQEKMVEIMQEEWKGYLIDEAHPTCDPAERLPRLDELLYKILVKVKKATQTPIKDGVPIVNSDSNGTLGSLPAASKSQTSLLPSVSTTSASTSSSLAPRTAADDHDSGLSDSDDNRTSKSSKKKTKKSTICESLSRLGIYTHSEHFSGFQTESAKHPPHVFSIAEGDILELRGSEREDMFKHNRSFFMRAYPSGRRVDSSNPDPSIFWRKGVQMVALNWQVWDEGTMINEGMFAGENGWVLKPAGFLEDANSIKRQTLDLKLTILAGQQIPLPPEVKKDKDFHPYIKCEVHIDKHEEVDGVPSTAKISGGDVKGTYKMSTPSSKGGNPDWGAGICLSYMGLPNVIEQLAFVRLKIEDDRTLGNDPLAAWACVRLDKLQSGVRFLKLYDTHGVLTEGMLLVKVEKTLR